MKTFDQIELQNQIEAIRQEVFRITNREVEEISLSITTGDYTRYSIIVGAFSYESRDLSEILANVKRDFEPAPIEGFFKLPCPAHGMVLPRVSIFGRRNRLSNIDEHFDKTFK